MSKVIKISEKFPFPGPRFIRLGPQSGEAFKNYLHKLIVNHYGSEFNSNLSNPLTINLDGTRGYGSSFLEEGFGGLVRMGVPKELLKRIKLISEEEPELVEEIQDYIEEA
jgi:hypothetical protein